MKLLLFSASAFLASVAFTYAQEASAAVSDSNAVPTLGQLFQQGGIIMWVLLAVSIFAISMVLYLAVVLREGAVAPRAIVRDVTDTLQKGKLQEARRICDYHHCAFSHIAMAGIDAVTNLSEKDPSTIASIIEDAIEGEGARQAARMDGRSEWLLDISSIAPMIGLLGTVIGMLTAFHAVGDVSAARPVVLANGVSMALVTTIFGLVIAVPCAVFYAIFRRVARRLSAVLECRGSEVLQLLLLPRSDEEKTE